MHALHLDELASGRKGLDRSDTIIHGRQDPVPWSVVEDIKCLLPHAAVVPLVDCGHFPWLERADGCREALIWES